MTNEVEPNAEPVPSDARPWWSTFLPKTPLQTVIGVLALMFLGGGIGYAIGFGHGTEDNVDADSADVGFLYDMTAHHQQALLLSALQLEKGEDPEASLWAREILRSQAYEVGLMEMRLGTFGHDPADRPETAMAWMGMSTTADAMPGMASVDELAAMRDAEGAEADALFYALMIDHHRGGVVMAERAAALADNDWVVETAGVMARNQAGEIAQMTAARDAAGLPAEPEGFTAD